MRWRGLFLPLVLFGLVGCGDTAGPAQAPTVALSLQLQERTAGNRLMLDALAEVVHQNGAPVEYSTNCGPEAIHLSVVDVAGNTISLDDPCGPIPQCPSFNLQLGVGGVLKQELVIEGTLYNQDCTTVPMLAGTYEVVARFTYVFGDESERRQLEQRAAFDWK